MNYPTSVVSLVIPIKPGLEPQAAARITGLGWSADRYELLIAEGTCPEQKATLAPLLVKLRSMVYQGLKRLKV